MLIVLLLFYMAYHRKNSNFEYIDKLYSLLLSLELPARNIMKLFKNESMEAVFSHSNKGHTYDMTERNDIAKTLRNSL